MSSEADCNVALSPIADFYFDLPQRTSQLEIAPAPEAYRPYQAYISDRVLPATTNPDDHTMTFAATSVGSLVDRKRYAKGIHKPSVGTEGCAGHTNCGCNPFELTAGTVTDRAFAEKYCITTKPVCFDDIVLTNHWQIKAKEEMRALKEGSVKMPHTLLRSILADESIKVFFSKKNVDYGNGVKLPFYMNPSSPTKWPTIEDLAGAGLTLDDVCCAPNMETIKRYFVPQVFSPKRFSKTTSAVLLGNETFHMEMSKAMTREYADYFNIKSHMGAIGMKDMLTSDSFHLGARVSEKFDHEMFNVKVDENGCFVPVTPCALFDSPDGNGEIEDFNPEYNTVDWVTGFLLPNDWIRMNPLQMLLNDPITSKNLQRGNISKIAQMNGSYIWAEGGEMSQWCQADPNLAGPACTSLGLTDSVRYHMQLKSFFRLGRTRPIQFFACRDDVRQISVFKNNCDSDMPLSVEPSLYGRKCCKLPGGMLSLTFTGDKLAEKGLAEGDSAFYQSSGGKFPIVVGPSDDNCVVVDLVGVTDSSEYCCESFDIVCPPDATFESDIATAEIDAEGGEIKFTTELLVTIVATGALGKIICSNGKEVSIVLTADGDGCNHCAALAESETCTLEDVAACDVDRVVFDSPK